MTFLQETLQDLVSLPHRGSTTQEEEKAADMIQNKLRELGYSAQMDSFLSPTTYSWEVILIAAMVAAGLVVAPWEPVAGAVLSALGLWSFVRHFSGKTTLLSKIIPTRPSQNVVGTLGGSEAENTVYLTAHYDTTRASVLFHPSLVKNFRQSFLASAAVVFLAPALAFLGEWFGGLTWYRVVTFGLGVYVFMNVVVLVHREFFHQSVNGANDNGSGVSAVLTMARHFAENRPRNTAVKIIATGCEEAGLYGARDVVKRYGSDLDSANNYVLNFDNVGAGDLYYCIGEGMLGFFHYDPELVSAAEDVSREKFPETKPLKYTRAYFDTLVFVHNHIKSISFIALNRDGNIPNWHWYSDTIDNIEWQTLQRAVDFGIAMVEKIDLA